MCVNDLVIYLGMIASLTSHMVRVLGILGMLGLVEGIVVGLLRMGFAIRSITLMRGATSRFCGRGSGVLTIEWARG